MNNIKTYKLMTAALKKLETNDIKSFNRLFKLIAEEITDPFAAEINEYLDEKQQTAPKDDSEEKLDDDSEEKLEDEGKLQPDYDAEHPQDQVEDKLEDESENKIADPVDDSDPQDQLEDKLDDELDENDEENIEDLEKQKKELDQKLDKLETNIESSLSRISAKLKAKGFNSLANKFERNSESSILEHLLQYEYLLKDSLSFSNIAYMQQEIKRMGHATSSLKVECSITNEKLMRYKKGLAMSYKVAAKAMKKYNLRIACNLENMAKKRLLNLAAE